MISTRHGCDLIHTHLPVEPDRRADEPNFALVRVTVWRHNPEMIESIKRRGGPVAKRERKSSGENFRNPIIFGRDLL